MTILTLDDEKIDRPVPLLNHLHQFPQMLLAPYCCRIGEKRAATLHHGHVLYLNVAKLVSPAQQKIDAAVDAIANLRTDAMVALQLANNTALDGLMYQFVGQGGIDTDPAIISPYQLPSVAELAAGLVAAGEKGMAAGHGTAFHTARVGAVGGDNLAAFKRKIGKESLVAADQDCRDEGR